MSLDAAQKQAWLREFHLNGFVILRSFLPVDLVAEMHGELMPLLEAEHDKARQDGFERGRGSGRLALRLERYIELMAGALADGRYRRHPVIEELVDAILGAASWTRGWTQVEVCWRGSGYMTWHPDQSPEETPDLEGPHEIVRVTYNIPLVDFTWANGSMEILPGSHLLPRNFLSEGDIRDVANIYPVRLDLRRGDVVLRDGNGLHRGTPNLTDEPRPMLDQTYKKS